MFSLHTDTSIFITAVVLPLVAADLVANSQREMANYTRGINQYLGFEDVNDQPVRLRQAVEE